MFRLISNPFVKPLCIGLVFIILTGCPHDLEDVQEITISNNSDNQLVFYKEYKNQSVLDTALNINSPWQNGISDFYIIKAHSSKEIKEVKSNLEFVLYNGRYQYFLFDYDTITTIPWDRIRDEYIVAKRIDFDTWEDLENCNFKIEYP